MFTIYQSIINYKGEPISVRITDNPVSYDYILKVLFPKTDIWIKLNVLPLGEAYKYKEFIFVREV